MFSETDISTLTHEGHEVYTKVPKIPFVLLRVLGGQRIFLFAMRGEGARATPDTYMIAVGGAGSSGRPAFASGTKIITATRMASAITAVIRWSPLVNWYNCALA